MSTRLTVTAAVGTFLAATAPPVVRAQFDARLMLGTRVGARSSQDGTANGPGGGARAIVLRQLLAPPWVVGGIRVGYTLLPRLALEFGYTAGPVSAVIPTSLTPNTLAARSGPTSRIQD